MEKASIPLGEAGSLIPVSRADPVEGAPGPTFHPGSPVSPRRTLRNHLWAQEPELMSRTSYVVCWAQGKMKCKLLCSKYIKNLKEMTRIKPITGLCATTQVACSRSQPSWGILDTKQASFLGTIHLSPLSGSICCCLPHAVAGHFLTIHSTQPGHPEGPQIGTTWGVGAGQCLAKKGPKPQNPSRNHTSANAGCLVFHSAEER